MTPGTPLAGSPPLPLTPPLKWAGGKRWLVPTLRDLYQPHRWRRLVEPFAGGLAVSLGLLPEQALVVDANQHAVNFYHWLQQGLVVEIPMENCRSHFDQARSRFNELTLGGMACSKEAAELFYYLNRTCFNGLCRFNRKGGFNVPFGRYKTINYTRDLRPYAAVLSRWQINCHDFEKTTTTPADFIYADPPYDVEFRQYSSGGFTWGDQERLAEWLSRHPGPVVVSNQATERILALYKSLSFHISILSAPRLIACNGDRTPASEMQAVRNLDRA